MRGVPCAARFGVDGYNAGIGAAPQRRDQRSPLSGVPARNASCAIHCNRSVQPNLELRSELALTFTPSCLARSKFVQAGVRGYMGVVAPAFEQPGGGVEFWFPQNAVVADSVAAVPGGAGYATAAAR
jgi:hypothetical protein